MRWLSAKHKWQLIVLLLCSVAAPYLAEAKKIKVSELLKESNEMMAQAQDACLEGDTNKGLELYRKALEEIERVEMENPQRVASSEFAPVRFRKAMCETEIDRLMLGDLEGSSRTVAVTDTRELEARRKQRKLEAATNNVPETTFDLSAKTGKGVVPAIKKSDDNPETESDKASVKKTDQADDDNSDKLNIGEELEWAREMLSLERYDRVNVALLKILKINPEHKEARLIMARSRIQQHEYSDATVVLEDLLEDYPRDESVLLLASGAYMAVANYNKAIDVLDRALKINPKRPLGYYNMAWLLLEMNPEAVNNAELYYRQAVKLGGLRDADLEQRLGIRRE